MANRAKRIALGLLTALVLVATWAGHAMPDARAQVAATAAYTVRNVAVYRDVDADDTMPLRYYADHPNVPYANVCDYFQRFFAATLLHEAHGEAHRYLRDKAYLEVNPAAGTITLYDVDSLTAHAGFAEANCRTFWQHRTVATPLHAKIIDLKDYDIDVYVDGDEAYLPLTLLGILAGGTAQYNVVYNGESVYVLDLGAELSPTPRDAAYYGEGYRKPMSRTRSVDMAQYTYRLLCLAIDQTRGYTRQTLLGDDNLLALGLDGTLETYYPTIKHLLLSTSHKEYHMGLAALFAGLWDGGHTCIADATVFCRATLEAVVGTHPELKPLVGGMMQSIIDKQNAKDACLSAREAALGVDRSQRTYYRHTPEGVAYVGWDRFEVDYRGWDAYYRGEGDVPQDTYAFVSQSLQQARRDGARRVVLDLACNGGGDTLALLGVLGLVQNAEGTMWINDALHRSRAAVGGKADLDLDGKFDDADRMAARHDFDVCVLTSRYSFSCGNLLPALLQANGCKTIGERSGGGGCAVTLEATADGVVYVRSSRLYLSDNGGHGIDEGVEADVPLGYAECYDAERLSVSLAEQQLTQL